MERRQGKERLHRRNDLAGARFRRGGLALLRAVDFELQEEVQRRPDGGNGGELTDFLPGGGHSGAQNAGGEQELQGQRQPPPEPKPHVFLRLMG